MKRIEQNIKKKLGTEKRLTHNEVLYLLLKETPVEILNKYMAGKCNLYMKDIDFLLKTRDKKKNIKPEELFKKPDETLFEKEN